MVVGRAANNVELSAPAGREMARWQAVYRGGCQMHLGPAAREKHPRVSAEPAKSLVSQPEGGHHGRRRLGLVPFGATAASFYGTARFRGVADLSVSYTTGADAAASDR